MGKRIDIDILSEALKVRVMEEYRAFIAALDRPLTYEEVCFFYQMKRDTLRRYIWEGRISPQERGHGGKGGTVTHAEMQRFCALYKPHLVVVDPSTRTQRAA